jgi:hypothetical protein
VLRNDHLIVDEFGFAPLDDGAQLLFRFVAVGCKRRALNTGSHWPFEAWGPNTPPPSRCSTGYCTTATS